MKHVEKVLLNFEELGDGECFLNFSELAHLISEMTHPFKFSQNYYNSAGGASIKTKDLKHVKMISLKF